MVKHTSLGHLKCWPLWDVDDKLISISAVIGHRVIFMDQVKGQDVCYPLGVILLMSYIRTDTQIPKQ